MRVLVLGGAGGMGAGGASLLVNYPEVKEIVLADLRQEEADKTAKEMNSTKVSTAFVDVTDRDMLINLAKDFDVVLNAIGPFVRFGVPILDAIIEAGVNYVDVCDDHDAAIELLKLDEKAKANDVTALICMGTTPGISNMQAKLAADKLDSVDSLKVSWAVTNPPVERLKQLNIDTDNFSGRDLLTPAAWQHMIHVSTGDVPIWKDGKWDAMPALEYGEYVDFAEPLGRAESYYLGHAEPVTLPRYIEINDFCACLGSLMPDVTKELRLEARGHEEPQNPPQLPDKPQWEAPAFWQNREVWAGQAAIAEGEKDGERLRYTVRFMMSGEFNNSYSYSGQAIGVRMVGSGEIKQAGVSAPEGLLDPASFFDKLAENYSTESGEELSAEDIILVEKEVL